MYRYAELPNVLPPHLSPASCANQPTVPWSNGVSPSPQWLRAFWREVGQSPPATLELFAAWPLVPVVGHAVQLESN